MSASEHDVSVKRATQSTKDANAQYLKLPFDKEHDFDNANNGFQTRVPNLVIPCDPIDDSPGDAWNLGKYKRFIHRKRDAPETVNPSLWRNAQLCVIDGLFKVTDEIYQVRAYDLSNITFIKSDSHNHWVVFDCLTSEETARAAFDLFKSVMGGDEVTISGVVYSHSHIDHFGGVRGIIEDVEEFKNHGGIIIAPHDFLGHAVAENVIAGNVMARRAVYMYGSCLPRNARGAVSAGLGISNSTGNPTMIRPTDTISQTGETFEIDGLEMIFQYTPGAEAPTEMNTWFPGIKALWMAENSTDTMHNILTLRGSQVRDSLKWAKYLQTTIDLYCDDVTVKFQAHHWPVWGNEEIKEYMILQRDCYKYIHDQTVRLMNSGYIGEEISEMLKFPESLAQNWATRGYYGTLSHNSRAVYQFYMGWYSGNPSDLNNLPPEQAAIKYMKYMGKDNVLEKAKEDYDAGEYRWVAEVMKHFVFVYPKDTNGKFLLADAYEQLGYQAESGSWRCEYLQGAYELRNPDFKDIPPLGTACIDIIQNMTTEMTLDYLSVRLNPEKLSPSCPTSWTMRLTVTTDDEFSDDSDNSEHEDVYYVSLSNNTLNYTTKCPAETDVEVKISKDSLGSLLMGESTCEVDVTVTGQGNIFEDFVQSLDTFEFWFDIVTPRLPPESN